MMNDDEIDMYTGERDLHYVFDSSDKEEIEDTDQDFRLVKSILEDMLYSYSHGYKGKKEIMIGNMTQMVKQMGDLNIRLDFLSSLCEPTGVLKAHKFNKMNLLFAGN
jgi:hypothetical protein